MAAQVLPGPECLQVNQRVVWELLAPYSLFLQASDHKQSNSTMVTSFIPSAPLAPAIQNSWHCFYPMQFPMQFGHAASVCISHFVLARRKRWNVVQVSTDAQPWLGLALWFHFKMLSVTPMGFYFLARLPNVVVQWPASCRHQPELCLKYTIL